MRPLTEDETKKVFEKLAKFIGRNIEMMINRSDELYCFRIVKDRVFYISESNMRLASNIGRDNLLAVGTCVGKFTKSGKFHLTIHCLDYLSQYVKYKVWVKPSAEMSFLYGNNINKAGVGRMTDDTPQYAGVVVYNMNDVPLGFGVAAQSTAYVKELDPTANVILHQCDVGEYLRFEDEMF
mmetsp:Transcript_83786/g.236723  ORF Transcript_83786/g.236723 Transcript_83786/m.236723 type:complete len:181 (+) Transcript_83786:581-1123(+)